jgi:phosphohistidine phosphatase
VELILFRHGIAIDREDPDCPPEEQRQLTEEGEQRTREAALGLKALGLAPERVLSSPLLRTLQTAAIAAEVLGRAARPLAVEEWPELAYWVDPELTLARLGALREEQVLLVGHRPHLDALLAAAMGGNGEPFTVLKKAGAALIDWSPPGGELRWLLTPAILRRLGGVT